jgi:hypothetical protein
MVSAELVRRPRTNEPSQPYPEPQKEEVRGRHHPCIQGLDLVFLLGTKPVLSNKLKKTCGL